VRLLRDQNLSPRLVRALADVLPECVHVRDLGLSRSDDRVVWDHAKASRRRRGRPDPVGSSRSHSEVRELTHPVPERLDKNDRTPFERFRRRRKDDLETLDDTRVTGVGKAEQNDARESPTRQGRDLAEVQVEGEDDWSTPMSARKRTVADYESWTCSWASQAAYSMACWTSSRSRSG
jgi:hypothetical protein